MANDYFSDNAAISFNPPLPSPAGTPYQSMSRRTSRFGSPGSEIASSPAPFPPEPQTGSEDTANDENISILDPRRFTPTLHANLVSEILNLRRELDSKHKFIEDLESNLYTVRTDNDSLAKQLSATSKENRNVKRQLQSLENESLSALEEIAGERDKSKDIITDLRDKLAAVQKKSRGQEEDSKRVHEMWESEKETWAGEKRGLEQRVHISEARLQRVLDEIALQEVTREAQDVDSDGEAIRDQGIGAESDAGSIRSSPRRGPSSRLGHHSRNMSNSSFRSFGGRQSRMSMLNGDGGARANGVSLADELIFDEEEEIIEELELDSDDFPENEMRARRVLESRQSMYPDEKAKRVLGLHNDHPMSRDDTLVEDFEEPKKSQETDVSSRMLPPREITLIFPPVKPVYVDSGVQPSPPPSPTRPVMLEASSQTTELPAQTKTPENNQAATEIEANQSRKRVSVLPSSASPPPHLSPTIPPTTSSAMQTIDHPLSPPDTPKIMTPMPPLPPSPIFMPDVASVSTQTDFHEEPAETPSKKQEKPSLPPITVPSIAIHAPSSAPSSPKEPLLPPGTKTTSTQTTGDLFAPMRSYGMQTDPIRIDQRLVKLPPHLLPSSISSNPATPEPAQKQQQRRGKVDYDAFQLSSSDVEDFSPEPVIRQTLVERLEKAAVKPIEIRYPGNNDNGPLSRKVQADILNRPFRTSSLFAGFDGPSSDEEDENGEISDDDFKPMHYATPMLSSRNAKNGRPVKPPTPVPEDNEPGSTPKRDDESNDNYQPPPKRYSAEKPARIGKSVRGTIVRQSSIRRSAMIQNGTAAHTRSRSPSVGSLGSNHYIPQPPFPVPTRSSSRKKPMSKSEGSQSPTPRHGAYAGHRTYGQRHQRKDSLRKVRSAAPVSKPSRSRSRSPANPTEPSIPDTSSIPPLPSDVVSAGGFGHRHQLSTNTVYTANGSINSAATQTSVVDAIAASMIGEFMWKYVRKRKAFGGPETPVDLSRAAEEASLAGNGVRHKRWVWISPYERAILWSTKQPTSGSALMGKSGRKLVIQSVLDVADTCPPPKNETLFNRSILILTPARALKFTAISRERHYVWLTALSFLAHSSSPIPDLNSMPPVPPPVEEPPVRVQGATLRRTHVRDSVRLAKTRANPVTQRYAQPTEVPLGMSLAGFEGPVSDAASPPAVPRGPHHGRKRSSTGPSAPPPNVPFRSFSHQHVPSIYSNGSSDMYSAAAPPSVPSSVYNPNSGAVSSRTSEASTSTRQHFFDTMGTMRMEAFIDGALGDPKETNSLSIARARSSRRRGSSQWSASTREHSHRAGGLFDDFDVNDPFRGF